MGHEPNIAVEHPAPAIFASDASVGQRLARSGLKCPLRAIRHLGVRPTAAHAFIVRDLSGTSNV